MMMASKEMWRRFRAGEATLEEVEALYEDMLTLKEIMDARGTPRDYTDHFDSDWFDISQRLRELEDE